MKTPQEVLSHQDDEANASYLLNVDRNRPSGPVSSPGAEDWALEDNLPPGCEEMMRSRVAAGTG